MERLRFSDWKETRVWERERHSHSGHRFMQLLVMMPVTVILFNGQKRVHGNQHDFFYVEFAALNWQLPLLGSSVHRSVVIFEVQFKTDANAWIRSCLHNNVKNAYLSLRIENKITCVKHRHGLRTSSTSGTTPTVINFQYIFFSSSLPQMKWNIFSVNNSYSLGLFSLPLCLKWYCIRSDTRTLMMADWLNTKRQNGRRWTNMYKMKSHRLKKHRHPHKLNVVYDYFLLSVYVCFFVRIEKFIHYLWGARFRQIDDVRGVSVWERANGRKEVNDIPR